MIPRLIHQTWKTTELPEELRHYQASWRKHHPDWEYRFWTDEDNELIIRDHYPQFLEHYLRVTPTILKIDFVRLVYLHHYGGLFIDLDFEALGPIDPLLTDSRIIVGREHKGIGRMMRGRDFIINALIASPPGHPLWLEIMHRMVDGYRAKMPWEFHPVYVVRMGLEPFDGTIEAHFKTSGGIHILPHEYFYPAPPSERRVSNRRKLAAALGSQAIHHYMDSWFSPAGHALNLLMWTGQCGMSLLKNTPGIWSRR